MNTFPDCLHHPPAPWRHASHSIKTVLKTGWMRRVQFASAAHSKNHLMSSLKSYPRGIVPDAGALLRVSKIRDMNFLELKIAWETWFSFPAMC